jgi:hypothetical protein
MGRSSTTGSRYSRPSLRVEFQIPGTEPHRNCAPAEHHGSGLRAQGIYLVGPRYGPMGPAVPVKIRRGLCLTKGVACKSEAGASRHAHFRPLTRDDLSHEHLPAKSRAVRRHELSAATPLLDLQRQRDSPGRQTDPTVEQARRMAQKPWKHWKPQPGCRARRRTRPPNCPPKLAGMLRFWSGVLH